MADDLRVRKHRSRLAYVAVAGSLLIVWQGASLFFPGFLFPGVPQVAERFAAIVGTGDFLAALGVSLYRIAVGYGLAILLGTVLGLAAGVLPWLQAYLRALVSVLQSVPPITWIPLLVIVMGFGDGPIIVVVTLASFFPMVQNVMSGVEQVDSLHLNVARVLGATRKQLTATVYLPAAFPAIVTGAQISFGNAWRALVASEMVAGVGIGLGWSITFAGEIADMAGVLVHIVVVGTVAAVVDRAGLEWLKHRLLRWRYAGND